MPSLNRLECTLEAAPAGTAFTEYLTTYHNSVVETYIAVPPASSSNSFNIRLKSTGYVAPGLAAFVFIDGVYQCNRNRTHLQLPAEGIPRSQIEVDFRLRQKEERSADGGSMIGKAWSFEKLNVGEFTRSPPTHNTGESTMLFHPVGNGSEVSGQQAAPFGGENVGVIEVLVLRCYASLSTVKTGPSTATSSEVSDDSNVDEKDEPLLQGAMFDGGNDEKPKHSRKSSGRLSGLFPLPFTGTSEMSSSSTLRDRSPQRRRQRKGEKIEIRESNVHIYNSAPRSSRHTRLTSESSELTFSARTETDPRHRSHGYQAYQPSSSRARRPSPRAHMASKKAPSPSQLQVATIPRLRGGALLTNSSGSSEEGQNGGAIRDSSSELKGVNAWASFANNASDDAGNKHSCGNGGQSGSDWNGNSTSKMFNDTWSNGNNGRQGTSTLGADDNQKSDQGQNQAYNDTLTWGKPKDNDAWARPADDVKQDSWTTSANHEKENNNGRRGLFGNLGDTKLGANDTTSVHSATKPFKWGPVPPMPKLPSLGGNDASSVKGKSPKSDIYVPLWDAEIPPMPKLPSLGGNDASSVKEKSPKSEIYVPSWDAEIPPMPKLPSLAASESSFKHEIRGSKPLKSALRRDSTSQKPRSSLIGSVGGAAKTLPGSWSPPPSPKKENKTSSTPAPLSDNRWNKQPAWAPPPPVSPPPVSSKPAPPTFTSPPHNGAHVPPLQARIKPYWAEWNHAPTTAIEKDNPIYTLPSEIATRENLTHQVRPVKGAAYRHKCERPQYLDTYEEPYALFVFKYREQSVIEGMVGRKLDVPTETEEQQRERLKRMTKDEIVEEVLKQRREGVALPTESATLEAGNEAANAYSASAPAWDSLKAWAEEHVPTQANDAGDSWGKNPKGAATTWTAGTSVNGGDKRKESSKAQADSFGNDQSGGNDWKNEESNNDNWGNTNDNGNGHDMWGSNDNAKGKGSSDSSEKGNDASHSNGNWGASTDADQNNNWEDNKDNSGKVDAAWSGNGNDGWKASDQNGGNGGDNAWDASADNDGAGTKNDTWGDEQVQDASDNHNGWDTSNDSKGAFMSGGLNDANANNDNWWSGDNGKNDSWDSGNNDSGGNWGTENNNSDAGNNTGGGGGDDSGGGKQTSGNSGGGGSGW